MRNVSTKFTSDFQYIAQICSPILILWSTNSDKHKFCLSQTLRQLCRKMQSTGSHVALNQLRKAGFIDRHLSIVQCLDFLFIDIDTSHIYTHLRETGSRNEPYITGANDNNFHNQ